MPSKYSVKIFADGYVYHVYNRGVEKRNIFEDNEDRVVFLRFLKEYLLPPTHSELVELQGINPRRHPINCNGEVELLAYCLMPNHFHLLMRQIKHGGITKFMRALSTNYVMYFNHKYDRVGPLFQGIYKAILVDSEQYYLHISRYIHRNPLEIITRDQPLQAYSFSSYRDYLGLRNTDWLNVKDILSFFKKGDLFLPAKAFSYRDFVENYKTDEKSLLGDLLFD